MSAIGTANTSMSLRALLPELLPQVTKEKFKIVTFKHKALSKFGHQFVLLRKVCDGDQMYLGMDLAETVPKNTEDTKGDLLKRSRISFGTGAEISLKLRARFNNFISKKGLCAKVAAVSLLQNQVFPIVCAKRNGNILYRVPFNGATYIVKAFGKDVTETKFLREVRLSPKLAHPNIARVLGACLIHQNPAIVMEDTGGMDGVGYLNKFYQVFLASSLRNYQGILNKDKECLKKLSQMAHRFAHARELLKQMISAVSHLQSHGMMHRDLKLDNLMIRGGDWGNEVKGPGAISCKFVDFGFLREVDEEDEALKSSSRRKRTYSLCGTEGWIAPELTKVLLEAAALGHQAPVAAQEKLDSLSYDGSLDNYGLGSLFFAMLVGKTYQNSTFPDGTPNLIKWLTAYTSKYDFQWFVPPDAISLLTRLLEKDPARRISMENATQHPFFNESFDDFKVGYIKYVTNYLEVHS